MNFQDQQQNMLKSFVEQRDELLLENSKLRQESDRLQTDNKNLTISNSEMTIEIAEKRGIIKEMEDHEWERAHLVSHELAALSKELSEKQLVNAGLEQQIESKRKEFDYLVQKMSELMPVYERVTWQVEQLTKTVEIVVKNNLKSAEAVNVVISDLRQVLDKFNK